MSARLDSALLRTNATVVPAPALRACEDHSFELPASLYATMAALFAGFLGVLAVGLADSGLIVPMGISFAFLTAFFAIPTIFVATANDSKHSLRWSEFMRIGVQTATGHSTGSEAAVLILMLPLLIFCWAIAIVVINALV